MRCDRCGRENPEHLTFCEDCGYNLKPLRKDFGGTAAIRPPSTTQPSTPSLQRPQAPSLRIGERQEPVVARNDSWQMCPTCQTRNQPGHRFCIACGGPIQSVAPPATPPATLPATPPASNPVPRPSSSNPLGGPRLESTMVTQQGENSQEILPAAPIVAIAEPAPPTPLRVTCPRCRVPVEAGGVYCRVCGQMIEKSVEKPIEIPQQKPAERPQQKPVERLQEPLAPPIPLSQPERTTPGTVLTASMNWGRLVQLAKDGSDEAAYPISSEQIDIGSQEGSVILQGDPYVSPRHARLVREGGQWSLVDLSSVNGIYLKVQGKKVLMDGDLILLGQQVLKFETVMEAEQALHPAFQHGVALFGTPQIPRFARLCQRTVEGITRDVYHIHRPEVSMGRETADIVFSDDPFLSRRHAVLKLQSSSEGTQSFLLEDAGSSNGTFVAIRGRERLSGGEVLRIGLHLFRVELTDKEGGRS